MSDLWDKVCATVTPLDKLGKRRKRKRMPVPMLTHTVDLHGFTVQEAYFLIMELIAQHSGKELTVITGKSGVIAKEFPDWMSRTPKVKSCTLMDTGGSFLLTLR